MDSDRDCRLYSDINANWLKVSAFDGCAG